MACDRECVVGVDGLPLGTKAALAVGGAIVCELDLTSDEGRPLDLQQRVAEAVRLGTAQAGQAVDEVRLAVVDDGTGGDVIGAIAAGLAADGLHLRVVDLVEPKPQELPSSAVGTPEAASVRRAHEAALADDAQHH
jgi:hypothetical protein